MSSSISAVCVHINSSGPLCIQVIRCGVFCYCSNAEMVAIAVKPLWQLPSTHAVSCSFFISVTFVLSLSLTQTHMLLLLIYFLFFYPFCSTEYVNQTLPLKLYWRHLRFYVTHFTGNSLLQMLQVLKYLNKATRCISMNSGPNICLTTDIPISLSCGNVS